MGVIFSRFRKSKTTMEILEDIQDNIRELEEFNQQNDINKIRVVKKVCFILISVYIFAVIYLYCLYLYYKTFPVSWATSAIVLAVLVLPPIMIYKIKHLLDFYYNRKKNNKDKLLKQLQDDRKEILDNVCETETYKVAKKILEKFCPETRKKLDEEKKRLESPIVTPVNSPMANGLRLRNVAQNKQVLQKEMSLNRSVMHKPTPMSPVIGVNGMKQIANLPRPILRQNRGTIDKMLEYVIGDGPNNRFALICTNCYAHNGMALKEEFEYIAYKCAYCGYFNKARKQKPGAPQLPQSRFVSPPPPRQNPALKFRPANNMSYSVSPLVAQHKPADSVSEVSTSGRSSAKINELSDVSDEEKDKKLEAISKNVLKCEEASAKESQVEDIAQESDSSSIVELENAEIQSEKSETNEDKKTK